MEAKELRIGNWVQRPDDLMIDLIDKGVKHYKVDSTMIRDCAYHRDNWAFEGIQLTEEWLERFGFDKVDVFDWFEVYRNKLFQQFYIQLDTKNNEYNLFWKGRILKVLKYVHDFQNTIYAIIGEELTLTKAG